jgi:neutral ceramidase
MYHAGWSKQEIRVVARGLAMHGYGQTSHRATGQQTPLYARALYLADDQHHAFIFCCLDLGYVTHAMREGVVARLRASHGEAFREDLLTLTCTHTHSGPGGCSHDVMYNLVTPGFVPEHVAAVVDAAVAAIEDAWRMAAPTVLGLTHAVFDQYIPVAWNRSIRAYNRNPDATWYHETETHLALDRTMQLLSLRREGKLQALVSLFGVHATCLGSGLNKYAGDNKGYAAVQAERTLEKSGVPGAVAIFAQGTAGDVSPYYHGPGDLARRRKYRGYAEYAYAEQNGRYQSDRALSELRHGGEQAIGGQIDAVFGYVDFTAIKADPQFANNEAEAWTSEPCHGVAFFAGTPVDGPGIPPVLAAVVSGMARVVRRVRMAGLKKMAPEDQAYYRRLYAAQGPKAILMEAGRKRVLGQPIEKLNVPGFIDPTVKEMKRQAALGAIHDSAMVPTVLPLQIITIGALALLCCPGEFTTMAGRRLTETVANILRPRGIRQVLICTYCNDYMGYVTTNEEYQEQAYEGGHTVFGQWTLAAFQTRFAELAQQLLKPEGSRDHDRVTRPAPVPEAELALRSNTAASAGTPGTTTPAASKKPAAELTEP